MQMCARAFIIVIVIWGGAGKGGLYNFHYYNIYIYMSARARQRGARPFSCSREATVTRQGLAGVARGPVRHGPADLTPAVLRTSPPRTMA